MSATALVVHTDPARLLEYSDALEGLGVRVFEARSFTHARRLLQEVEPDLVVAAIKLGAYNGLHLALVARHQMAAARFVLIGSADLNLGAEAAAAGATYIGDPDVAAVIAAVRQQLAGAGPNRRWIRKSLERTVRGLADGAEVRVVDVSYGGVRLELDSESRETLAGGFRLQLPEFDVSADASPVWQVADVETGRWTCGASVTPPDQAQGSAWRRFVDLVPG